MYFENPDLDIVKLYKLFKEKTGRELSMKYLTYHKHFRAHSQYSFRKSRSDVCDFCTKAEALLKVNPNDPIRVKYDIHKRKIARYQSLKKEFIANAKEETSTLVLAQNRPLPKLTVNSQFYKRLLWFYILHNDDTSTLYRYLENGGEKNCNSVCSMVYDFISKKMSDSTKKIILFSDSAGGQNKSVKITYFLAWLSKALSVEIELVYPVRGHSYCICDRNFGLYSMKLKKVEVVETSEVYVKALENVRSNPYPFEVVHAKDLVSKNWFVMLSPYMFKVPKSSAGKWTIQKYCILLYQSGMVSASLAYMKIFMPFRVMKGGEEGLLISEESRVSLKEGKVQDIKTLTKYFSPNGKEWFDRNVFAHQ